MAEHELLQSQTGGLPLSPALAAEIQADFPPPRRRSVDRRVVVISGTAMIIGVFAVFASQLLLALIDLFTNLCYFGRLSLDPVSPADNSLGLFAVGVPIVGGFIVGVMARYGSKAIRGHGIPEAMEQVLTNQSRIPARITFLKPLSAAISIGTGGPFGAEGPIIATGGALGSLVGQIISTTPSERKALLSAGAAAGMTATFGTPLAAIFLAIELLLFEFRPQSLIPVALASVVAAAGRMIIEGTGPVFAMPAVAVTGVVGLVAFLLLGALFGTVAVAVTRITYAVEDAFERLPIHWMWWPALGGMVIGVVGLVAPRTLGVGYNNLRDLLAGSLPLQAVAVLGFLKFISWSISLGSGTSGGTLAPLLTIGGCLGAALAQGTVAIMPGAGVDPRTAALVGMAALFAGASRAPFASAVFAFEATREPNAILPLLCGCTASYLVSCLLMRTSIMTEKIARRGVAAPTEYTPDVLEQVLVCDAASRHPVVFQADETLGAVRRRLSAGTPESRHQGFPVVDETGLILGVITRKDLENGAFDDEHVGRILRRPPIVVYDDCNVREAAEHMVRHDVGRLPVVRRGQGRALIGMITRSDILAVYSRRLKEMEHGTSAAGVTPHRAASA